MVLQSVTKARIIRKMAIWVRMWKFASLFVHSVITSTGEGEMPNLITLHV